MFSASRLALARKRRGHSLVDLAVKVGVSAQSLSNYENLRQVPSGQVVTALADFLKFPESFFFAADIEQIGLPSVSFRSRSKLPARQRDMALSASRLAIEFHGWISERFRLPAPDLPSLSKPDPETAAEMVRARWAMGTMPVGNMVHLLEAHGVRVFSIAAEYSSVDAFSLFHESVPFVFLNMTKTGARGRFDAAHELGHLVLHAQAGRDLDGTKAEQEANDFASAFLMPRESILARMPASPFIDQIIYAKSIWNVSALALTYRLHDMGMLSDWHYRTTCIELGRRGYRTSEPNGPERETSQLLNKVFRSLRAKGVSRADMARAVHVYPEDLNDYVFGLVMTALDGGDSKTQQNPPVLTILRPPKKRPDEPTSERQRL